MTSGPLFVPMHLDAMVLNKELTDATPFARALPDYKALGSLGPVWKPFGESSGAPAETGIHLHWTLPRPLRHGTATTKSADPDWPLVPNRWLVVRVRGGTQGVAAVKAWIVASDAHVDEPDKGTSPFVKPPTAVGEKPEATLIGAADQVTPQSKLPAPTDSPFLRAVGPASAEFSVYAPAAVNIFGFYDDMTAADGTTPVGKGTFTYHVAGWYSDPRHDPLGGRTWTPTTSTDAALKGSVSDDRFGFVVFANPADVPQTMLVHALLWGVDWDPDADNLPAAGMPKSVRDTVRVGFGNTAVDALAGIVRNERGSQPEADLLEAFGYGVIDHFDGPGSAQALDMAIRRAWFGSSPGGHEWTVVAAEAAPGADPAPQQAPLNSDQQDALAALNAAQRKHDRQARVLAAMRWRLWGLWWKREWASQNPLLEDETDFAAWIQSQLALHTAPAAGETPTYLDQVTKQAGVVAGLRIDVDNARSKLDMALGGHQLTAKRLAMPEFHAPGDPVMVVTGLGRSANLDPVEGLVCRLPQQAVTELTVGTDYGANGAPPLEAPDGLLPDGAGILHAEAYLLSPALLAADVLGDADKAPLVAAAVAALPAPARDTAFPPLEGAREQWKQPWVPLVLEWEVVVLREPAYEAPKDPRATLFTWQDQHWTFHGSDFDWSGSIAARDKDFSEASSAQMTLQGRTFVTPQVSFSLAKQIDDWVKQHSVRDPDLAKLLADLDGYVQGVASQDVLSQRLSGMRALMVQRDFGASPAVSDPAVAAALDQMPQRGTPNPFPDDVYGSPVWDFAPLSGTFFTLSRLRVTDFMGRTVDLLLGNGSGDPLLKDSAPDADYFYPIAGRGLQSPTLLTPRKEESADATQRMLQLPPRLQQDAQVSFRFLANDGTDRDVALVSGGNPVCGWVVPNHLDRSLALYDPDGGAWGELFLSRHAGDRHVPRWEPDPIVSGSPVSVGAIPNKYVAGWLGQLAGAEDGDALSDTLLTIDETLWNVDPRGARKDQALSVLVGRPLAVVRAELVLRIAGLPAVSQDWWNTFLITDRDNPPVDDTPAPLLELDGGVRDYRWPVRLGDATLRNDGLIGYFADPPSTATGGFAHMAAVHASRNLTSSYVVASGDSTWLRLRAVDDTVADPDPEQEQVVRLTMLVDPRGGVHAFSGLLPVETLTLPPDLYMPALRQMAFRFRTGPLLTPPDELRIPRPSERKGTWSWFDHIGGESRVAPADGNVRLPATPSIVREGWLKLKPDDAEGEG